MGKIIVAVILGIISIVCFVFSYRQFQEKGFLFNNAYIYASKEQREAMDKKPHYKQSGIVFLFIGMVFLINALEAVLQTGWLFYVVIGIAVATIIYAIVSTIKIEKKKKG